MDIEEFFYKATQAEIWSAYLSDDGETVLRVAEWEHKQALQEEADYIDGDSESGPRHQEYSEPMTLQGYLQGNIDAILEDGIRDSDDAMALAFYLLAKERLAEELGAAAQRDIDQNSRYQL